MAFAADSACMTAAKDKKLSGAAQTFRQKVRKGLDGEVRAGIKREEAGWGGENQPHEELRAGTRACCLVVPSSEAASSSPLGFAFRGSRHVATLDGPSPKGKP
jgi:hypothetical protein